MAVQISIDVGKQIDGIRSALRKYPEQSFKEFSDAIKKSVLTVQGEAIRNAPVNKLSGGGNLRQSIRSQITGLVGRVIAWAGYAIYVHEGTKAHIIRVKNRQVLANKRRGIFFGKVVRHPGTVAQPFLRRAVERSMTQIQRFFMQSMERIASLRY